MFRLLIVLCASTAAHGALPLGWKACRRADPKYNQCLSKEIENAVRSLANGDKSLKVLPLDPLRISELKIGKGSGPVSLDLVMRDADGYGLKNIQVKDTKNDWKRMTVKAYIPKFTVLSDYKVDGKVMVLPITGEGRGNLTFEHLTVNGEVKWKRIKRGNTEYFNMESLTVPLMPKRMYFNLENLFNGNKALGDNMNKFLNENWSDIMDELRDPVSEALSMVFIQIANQILSQIPANEIDK
ncbi:unnamed protein product [Nezara viridula]|uniref:Uncharacterized protein n=1 Tax=Nezara viridula TaxID=85310 RepID=A0A9P0H8Q7_NEZVI|nr:unnamed protein product [Nezara viridula]